MAFEETDKMSLKDAMSWILSSTGPISISDLTYHIITTYIRNKVDLENEVDLELYENEEELPIIEEDVKLHIEKYEKDYIFKYGIVALKSQEHPIEGFEKKVYKVLDAMRGYFKRDIAGILILPQIFIFRISQLAKEDQLPEEYKKLKLGEMELCDITDLCDMMNRINHSEIPELKGSMGVYINEFEALKGIEVFEQTFNNLKDNNYSSYYLNEKNFGKLYSSLIKNVFSDSLSKNEHLSSKFTREVLSNIKLSSGSYKILDPAFGTGSSIINFINNQRKDVNIKVHGYELNQKTYGYAVMNLICNGIYSFNLLLGDCLKEEWESDFDLILSDPPIKPGNQSFNFIVKLANKIFENLTENGQAGFLVSNNILFASGKIFRERKQWIHQKLLKKVIALPKGEGRIDSNILTSILYFENRKSSDNGIEFYDFETSFDELNGQLKGFIEKIFPPLEINSSVYQRVDFEKVIEKNYNLLPKRYVGKTHKKVDELKKKNKLVKLQDILEHVSGKDPNEAEIEQYSDKIIKIKDLKDDLFDTEIDFSSYSSDYDLKPRSERYKLIDDIHVLLIANRGRKLKPTYINTQGRAFLIDNSMWAFHKIGEVISEYLLYQLNSSFFQKQLNSIQYGSTIPHIKLKDFLNLYVELPSMNEYDYNIAQENFLREKKQEAFEKVYREKKKETEQLKKKVDSLKYEEETFNDVKEEELVEYINHNVRNKLSPVKDSFELIYDFMRENEGATIDLSALEGEPLKGEDESDLNTINELFKMAEIGLDNALQSLKRLEDFRLNEYKPKDFEKVNLFSWLKKKIASLKKVKDYQIEVTTKEVNPDKIFNVEIVPSAFKDLIDNLLENAERHGFKHELKNYKVLFELSLEMIPSFWTIK